MRGVEGRGGLRSEAGVAKAEGAVGIVRIEFGQQPGAACVAREELHNGKEINADVGVILFGLAAKRTVGEKPRAVLGGWSVMIHLLCWLFP